MTIIYEHELKASVFVPIVTIGTKAMYDSTGEGDAAEKS